MFSWSAGHASGSSASHTAPRLTYPQEPDQAGLHAEESESDILPFAIDGDTGASLDVTSTSPDAQTGASLAEHAKAANMLQCHIAKWKLCVKQAHCMVHLLRDGHVSSSVQ